MFKLHSYDFVAFCCVGSLALPKNDKIDPWRLAVSGPFALGPFALIIKNESFELSTVVHALCLYLVWLTEIECG
jgi:hypothetical protein